MEKLLSHAERFKLINRHRKERDRRVCDRIKAVLLYDKGYSYSEIADILLLDDATIGRHINEYLNSAKLHTANGGSESKLDAQQQVALVSHLQAMTYLYVKDICAYVKQTYGIVFSVSGMTDWLKRVGFRYKKPHGVPAKADAKAQQAFIADYQRLKAKDELIYFVDSVHPQHQTQLNYGWIMSGERKAIAMTGCQKRLHVTGAINLQGHRFIYQCNDKVNSDSFQQFLMLLHHKHKTPLHIILDNARWHKTAEVTALAAKLQITLHYLPPYSPNLNPIERLWKVLHEQVTSNHFYEKFADFRRATQTFLTTIGRKKLLLRQRITDHFQTLIPLNFAS